MILHLETSTSVCSVALSNMGVLLNYIEENSEQYVHGERLTLLIAELLISCQITMLDLHAVSVGVGPGSYTGLRIGVSVAKGIAYGLNVPIFGVSSLESLIAIGRKKYAEEIIVAAFDARRNEVFMRIEKGDLVICEDQAVDLNRFNFVSDQPIVLVGNASFKVLNYLQTHNKVREENLLVSSKGQVEIVWGRWQGNQTDSLTSLLPNYSKPVFFGN